MNTDQTPQTPLRHAEGSRGGLDWLDGGNKRIFPKDWLNKNADGFWVDDFGWQNIQKKQNMFGSFKLFCLENGFIPFGFMLC